MKILASHVDFRLFSKYRSMLMGIAIFEVMLGHAIGWNEITFSNPLISFVVSRLISTVHTPGFLLLSGLGLSYSYSRNNDIKQFYLRRLQRMWLPFIMMAAPVYAFICMKNETGGGEYLIM